MFGSNDTAFQEYNALPSRGYGIGECTDSCKTDTIRQLRAALAEYDFFEVTPGIDFRKKKREMLAMYPHMGM